jgi:hypothetical protein
MMLFQELKEKRKNNKVEAQARRKLQKLLEMQEMVD